MRKKVLNSSDVRFVSKVSRSKNSKNVSGSALLQRKIAHYPCPNCGAAKPTLQGRCPECKYVGLK